MMQDVNADTEAVKQANAQAAVEPTKATALVISEQGKNKMQTQSDMVQQRPQDRTEASHDNPFITAVEMTSMWGSKVWNGTNKHILH